VKAQVASIDEARGSRSRLRDQHVRDQYGARLSSSRSTTPPPGREWAFTARRIRRRRLAPSWDQSLSCAPRGRHR